jgi:diadenylate cyclase
VQLLSAVNTIKLADYIDWLVVAFLIYHAGKLVRETRAMQLIKGIAAILLVYFFAIQLEMNTLKFVLESIVRSGVLLLAVLFQPELRRALEQVGRSKISGLGALFGPDADVLRRERAERLITSVSKACEYLSERKTGALIVLERETKLGEIVKTGTVIDATPGVELITNIFFSNSPLHDGAMVAREGRLHAAGCFLPLSSNMEIGRELGTRHRAALGLSEVSDALVIVVSEETGAVSAAIDSRLNRSLSTGDLLSLMCEKLLPQDAINGKKPVFRRAKK